VGARLPERFAQRIDAPPEGRSAIDGGGRLDARVPHLRLDHVERHLSANGLGAKGVAQPVRGGPGQGLALMRRQV